jgi:hypothetical protein
LFVRETIVMHSRLSWRQVRGAAAIEHRHGLQALAIEHLAARLAGGFLQAINSDSLITRLLAQFVLARFCHGNLKPKPAFISK